jgi:3-oxoacyl-[acyl-carrier protein] reductase
MTMIQSSLPALREAAAANPERGSRVLAMASIAGVYAERGLAAYSATKAGLVSVVEALNQEESSSGVLGVVLAPGFVATDMSTWMHDQLPPESMIPVSDVVAMAQAVLDLSARSMLATVVMARSGTSGHVA